MSRWVGLKAFSIFTLAVLVSVVASASGETVSAEAQTHMDRGLAATDAASTDGDYQDAIREFQQAATLAPDWPDPYFNIGKLQEKLDPPQIKGIVTETATWWTGNNGLGFRPHGTQVGVWDIVPK